MSENTRDQLLGFFDLKKTITFANGEFAQITRRIEADGSSPVVIVSKTYSGALSPLQRYENEMIFALSQLSTSKQLATMRMFKHTSAMGTERLIHVKWMGFDLDDWYELLADPARTDAAGKPLPGQDHPEFAAAQRLANPLNQARFLLELLRAALVALHELHRHGFVHLDIHGGNWCLPLNNATPRMDGSVECTLNPDHLTLIDFGIALRPQAERVQPLKDERNRVVLRYLNSQSIPPHAPRVLAAFANAVSGDNALWAGLDWRVDLWRMGALARSWAHWANVEPRSWGLSGPIAYRLGLQNIAIEMQAFEEAAAKGASAPLALPHQSLIDSITKLIGPTQPTAVQVPMGHLMPQSLRAADAEAPRVPTTLIVKKPQSPAAPAVLIESPLFGKLIQLPAATADALGTLLGDPDINEPQYQVRVPYKLCVAETAFTFAQWDACHKLGLTKHRPEDHSWGRGERPVINVSWVDVQTLLGNLNEHLGIDPDGEHALRLLTQAEWEYACRAGSNGPYSLGPDNAKRLSAQSANYDATQTITYDGKETRASDQRGQTVAVKTFEPNAWGLYEMHGNVWEWVQDGYHADENAKRSALKAPWLASQASGPGDENRRGLRGGSWFNNPQNLRSANRNWLSASLRDGSVGLRVARTAP